MSKYFEFINTVKIICGENSLENLKYELSYYNCKHVLLLSDNGLKKVGTIDKFLKITGISPNLIYTNIPQDSSTETINEIAKQYKESKCDGIIALGGGSVIDTAKSVRMTISQNKKDIKQLMGNEIIKKGLFIPFLVIPTTCGTGSECTSIAVVKDEKTQIKMEYISSELLPNTAFIDVRMTETLPPKLVSSTALDALCHAIEAYTSIQKNPISDIYSLSAIKLINDNLLKTLKNPNDKESRQNIALASTLAGIAFSNSMVGVVHAIGHSLGAVKGIPHGNAMATLLPACMQMNLEYCTNEYSEILFYLNPKSDTKLPKNRALECINEVIQIINKAGKISGMLHRTSDYGVTPEDEKLVIEKAMNDGAIIMNKKTINKREIQKILEQSR